MRRFVHTVTRTWSLLDEQGTSMGTLMRPKWWSHDAELVVPEGVLQLRPTRVLQRSISAFLGDAPLLKVEFPWRGGIVIIPSGQAEEELRLRRTAWFREEWSVTDARGEERARIQHRFNWKLFEYEPVLLSESGAPLSAMLLLVAVQSLFVLQRRRSAAVS